VKRLVVIVFVVLGLAGVNTSFAFGEGASRDDGLPAADTQAQRDSGVEADAATDCTDTSLYEEIGGYLPYTPWCRGPILLPSSEPLDYASLAQQGVQQAERWQHGPWYCEYLRCPGEYPLATLWGAVPLLETVDALQLAEPSTAHLEAVEHIGSEFARFFDKALMGYAPYQGDSGSSAIIYFDDNGWLGLAYLNAYEATGNRNWLDYARRAFRFSARLGWDAREGGGMWWDTPHEHLAGAALAADSLLGVLLYNIDRRSFQLEDVERWMKWANAHDVNDERSLYLDQPAQPEGAVDYVQAPMIYAEYLLCADGAGESYCERAGRTAATMAEEDSYAKTYKYNHGPEYDTIFMQWMMAYGKATGQDYWLHLAELNADAAASYAANGEGLWLQSWWGGEIDDSATHPGMLRTEAAAGSLFAWVDIYARKPAAATLQTGTHETYVTVAEEEDARAKAQAETEQTEAEEREETDLARREALIEAQAENQAIEAAENEANAAAKRTLETEERVEATLQGPQREKEAREQEEAKRREAKAREAKEQEAKAREAKEQETKAREAQAAAAAAAARRQQEEEAAAAAAAKKHQEEAGKVTILAHKATAKAITVTVKAPSKGALTASGAGLKTVRESVNGKGSHKLRLGLTAAEQKKLKRKNKLTLRVKVAFRPASGKSSSAAVTIKIASPRSAG
jgi:Glycosyl hydrolase family 76